MAARRVDKRAVSKVVMTAGRTAAGSVVAKVVLMDVEMAWILAAEKAVRLAAWRAVE